MEVVVRPNYEATTLQVTACSGKGSHGRQSSVPETWEPKDKVVDQKTLVLLPLFCPSSATTTASTFNCHCSFRLGSI